MFKMAEVQFLGGAPLVMSESSLARSHARCTVSINMPLMPALSITLTP